MSVGRLSVGCGEGCLVCGWMLSGGCWDAVCRV